MKALVIIPTYNEIENIAKMLKTVLSKELALDILIIDDNSPDGTADVVKDIMQQESRIKLIQRSGKLGLGSAYVKGFEYALANAYEYILEMDADFSHNPKDLSRLLEAAQKNDLVIGSRYINGVNIINWPFKRLLISYFASKYVFLITRMPIKDPTAGFKCFRRQVLESMDLNQVLSDGYAFQIEMNFRTWVKGFKIKEIPIVFTERIGGTSKMSKQIVWEAAWMVWRLYIMKLLKIIK